ncbi:PREDICTED: uncharacterized protein LOC108565423 [Nicrophorus vespilloides]|uniref:Uncharacterized protein LOC108565423 n=1 Tax=Nicrophorus vespilloides TaxID=110193 RepID=A0ABM1N0K5_NICVS|nr:PREDICTED: uncharacterized protein LOC108565423 [Nicrophorus vespilloides]
MKNFIQHLVSITIQLFWSLISLLNSVYQRSDEQVIEMEKPKVEVPVKRKQSSIIDYRKTRISKSTSNLLFNTNKNSLINLSDLITPVEEEMLRCLCAKGYTERQKIQKFQTKSESCISRDTFTNIWIDSCCSV